MRLDGMRFAVSAWLWLILVIPLFYAVFARDLRRRREEFSRFASPEVWEKIAPELDWGARLRKARVWCLAMFFLILALARPQWGTHEETSQLTGLDLMIALDVSSSMDTEDVVPSRLKKAKHVIRSVVERLNGDRVGIVAFAASSYVACPLTTDLDYVLEALDTLGPNSILNQGTDLGLGLDTAAKALERGAEEATTPNSNHEGEGKPSRAVLLLSDGEDHEQRTLEGARRIRDSGARLYVMGIGTSHGGPIPMRDETGQSRGFKRDASGQTVVSAFHPETLSEIASAAGGKYWNVTPSEAEVDELLQDLGALDRSDYSERRYVVYEDRFQFPLAIGLLLILIELSMSVRAVAPALTRSSGSSSGGSSGSPKNRVTGWLIITLVSSLVSAAAGGGRDAFADGPSTPIDSYLSNEKGIKDLKEGKLDDARREFGSAQALDPSSPEVNFNEGIVKLQQDDPEGAASSFEQSGKAAMEHNNWGLAGKSFFNRGAALTKKGDTTGALKAYIKALGSARNGKDAQLEDDIRTNIKLLQKQKQQQKQEQQDQQKSDQQKQQNQQSQSGNSKDNPKPDEKGKPAENKDGKKDDQKKDKDSAKNYEDPSVSRKRFKSSKLNSEDADRVMAELSNKEKELQGKMKKQKGASERVEKDW